MARFGEPYGHINDAAAAALMMLARQPRVQNQEYMGMLIQDPDSEQFYRTEFQTEGKRNTSSWRGYPDGLIRGIVHNHPVQRSKDVYENTTFSEQDVKTSDQLEAPNFITAMQDDEGLPDQRKFDPETTRRQSRGRQARAAEVAIGDEFLAQFPIEEFKQVLMRELLDRSPNDSRGLMR